MEGQFIFDQQNDIVYMKLNNAMRRKIYTLARLQDLVEEDAEEYKYLDPNIILHIFSPIVTSQRILFCQFDNSYDSLQLEDDLNMVFDEFLGYLFISFGTQPVQHLHRITGVCVAMTRRLCGPDIFLLKQIPSKADLLNKLLDTWSVMYHTDPSILVEAVEHLLVNKDLQKVARKTLEGTVEILKQDPHSQRCQSFLFVRSKFLAFASSKQAQELSHSDILFLILLIQSERIYPINEQIQSNLIFLQGHATSQYSGCIPYIVHMVKLFPDIVLIILIEYGSLPVANGMHDIFFSLNKIQALQLQNDLDNLKPAFERLETTVRHLIDSLKRAKYNCPEIDTNVAKLTVKWDLLRKKYADLFKNCEKDLIVTIESNIPVFIDILKRIFRQTCIECSHIDTGIQRIHDVSTIVSDALQEFTEFLVIKADNNYTLTSYMEDFPGMVHFIHINRSSGQVIPLSFNVVPDEILQPLHKRVWSMIEYSRTHLLSGQMAVMWKDTAFNYSYTLWFEDDDGTPLKPKDFLNLQPANPVKPNVIPGVISSDFYQWLIDNCFPKHKNIKCYELYCVHLGLVSSSCVLEHCRRLAATIIDITKHPDVDLNIIK